MFFLFIFMQPVSASSHNKPSDFYSNIDHSISLDITALSLDYKEFKIANNHQVLDTVKGIIPGYSLLFATDIGPFSAEINYRYNKGSLKYEQRDPYITHYYKHRMYDYYAQLTYPFNLPSSRVYPLIRIGYRDWFRAMGAENIKTHYPEYYSNYYWLVGFGWTKPIGYKFLFDVKFMFGRTFNARITTPPNNVVILPLLKLGDSNIYGIQTKLYYNLTTHILLNTYVQYERFNYGKTKTYSIPGTSYIGFIEPNSETHQLILGFGVTYEW